MFHANTPQHNKEVILQSLLLPDGVVRVVFATVALGMGVNLRDINTIIHYGAPRSVEDYFQESGRGGRSGGDAVSTIYWKPMDCRVRKKPVTLRDHELIAVRRYLENISLCRRKWLLDHFDVKMKESIDRCCDVCSGTVQAVISDEGEGDNSPSDSRGVVRGGQGGGRPPRSFTLLIPFAQQLLYIRPH